MGYTVDRHGPAYEASKGIEGYVAGLTFYHLGSGRRDDRTMREVADIVTPILNERLDREYSRDMVARALKDRCWIMRDFKGEYVTVTGRDGSESKQFDYSTASSCGAASASDIAIITSTR